METLLWTGIRSVLPATVLRDKLSRHVETLLLADELFCLEDIGKLTVIAVGKAAFAMAQEAEKILGDVVYTGVCITKYEHAGLLTRFSITEAGHPIPDEQSLQAAKILEELTGKQLERDVFLLLISGGASSLIADIPAGCSLAELQACVKMLVNSGAGIDEINVVRKHLGTLKGGQLAAKIFPASTHVFIISDVLGDDLGTIGSGMTAPDESNFQQAKNILRKYDCWNKLPGAIAQHIEKGLTNKIPETPKPGDPIFEKVVHHIIASNKIALQAIADKAAALGYHPTIHTANMKGDTVKAAEALVDYLLHFEGSLPACIIMGGETTLQVTGSGKGGRNQHFVLAAVHAWQIQPVVSNKRVVLMAVGTDGTDGPTDAAGAVFDTAMLGNGRLDEAVVQKHLDSFDSYPFLKAMGMQVNTGPTQTNVMDIIIALIVEKE